MINQEEKDMLKKCVDASIANTSNVIAKTQDEEQSNQGRAFLKMLINLLDKVDSLPIDEE